jgi:hypothetical protein
MDDNDDFGEIITLPSWSISATPNSQSVSPIRENYEPTVYVFEALVLQGLTLVQRQLFALWSTRFQGASLHAFEEIVGEVESKRFLP